MSDSKLDISFDASKVLKSLEKLNLKFNETETSINNFVNSANNFINIFKNIDKVSKPIKDLGTGFKNIKNNAVGVVDALKQITAVSSSGKKITGLETLRRSIHDLSSIVEDPTINKNFSTFSNSISKLGTGFYKLSRSSDIIDSINPSVMNKLRSSVHEVSKIIEDPNINKNFTVFSSSIGKLGTGFSKLASSSDFITSINPSVINKVSLSIKGLSKIIEDPNVSTNFSVFSTSIGKLGAGFSKLSASSGFITSINSSVITKIRSAIQGLSKIIEDPNISKNFSVFSTSIAKLGSGFAKLSKSSDITNSLNSSAINNIRVYIQELSKIVADPNISKNFTVFSTSIEKLGSGLSKLSKYSDVTKSLRSISQELSTFMKKFYRVSNTKYFAEFEHIANTLYKVADAMRYLKITTANAETSVNRIKNAISSAIQPINLFAGGWRAVISSLIGGSVIYTIIRAVQSLVGEFTALDYKLRQLNIILGYNDTELNSISQSIKEVSAQYGVAATKVADALYEINQATITGKDSLVVMKQAVQLATASNSDLTESARILASTIKAFNTSVYDSAYISGLFFQIQERGIITIEQLVENFPKLIGSASATGVSFEDLGAAISTATSSGLKANQTMTAFNSTLIKIASGNAKLDRLFQTLGDKSAIAALRSKGLVYVLKQIQYATGGALEGITELGFDYRASRFVTAVTQGNALAENVAIFNNTLNTATKSQKAMEEASKSITVQFNKIRESVRNSGMSILDFIANATGITKIVKILADFISSNNEVIKSIKNFLSFVSKWTLSIGTFIFLIGGLNVLLQKLRVTAASTSMFFSNLFNNLNIFPSLIKGISSSVSLMSTKFNKAFGDIIKESKKSIEVLKLQEETYGAKKLIWKMSPEGNLERSIIDTTFVKRKLVPEKIYTSSYDRSMKRSIAMIRRDLRGVLSLFNSIKKAFNSLYNVFKKGFNSISIFIKNPIKHIKRLYSSLVSIRTASKIASLSLRGLALTIHGVKLAVTSLTKKLGPLLLAFAAFEGIFWLIEKIKSSMTKAIDTSKLKDLQNQFDSLSNKLVDAKSSLEKAKLAEQFIKLQQELEPLRETLGDTKEFNTLDRNLNNTVQGLNKYVETSEEASNQTQELTGRIKELSNAYKELFNVPFINLYDYTQELIRLQEEYNIAVSSNDKVRILEIEVQLQETKLQKYKSEIEYLKQINDIYNKIKSNFPKSGSPNAATTASNIQANLDNLIKQYGIDKTGADILTKYQNELLGNISGDEVKRLYDELNTYIENNIKNAENLGKNTAKNFVSNIQESVKNLGIDTDSNFNINVITEDNLKTYKNYIDQIKIISKNIDVSAFDSIHSNNFDSNIQYLKEYTSIFKSLYSSTGIDTTKLDEIYKNIQVLQSRIPDIRNSNVGVSTNEIIQLKELYTQLIELANYLPNVPSVDQDAINEQIKQMGALKTVLDEITASAKDYLTPVYEAYDLRKKEKELENSSIPYYVRLNNLIKEQKSISEKMSEYKAKDMTNTEDFAKLLEKSFEIQDKIDEMRNVKLDGTAKATVEAYEIGSRSAMELINKTAGDKLLNYTKSMADNSEKSLKIFNRIENLLDMYFNSSPLPENTLLASSGFDSSLEPIT